MKLRWKEWLKTRTPINPEAYVGSDASRNMRTVKDQFLDKARGFLRGVPLASEIVALYYCMLDSKTPMWVKAAASAALAYFILPLDAVPDILPIVGLTDDLSVLSAALAALAGFITPEHRQKAHDLLASEHVIDAEADLQPPPTP
ncbi:MAG TPA: DUF1232 domain-containing protein [Isosphaeraceae bacterium]|nr:DUF1232 domain-containing protein [Isosphaeraceae bacterium]